MSAASPRPRSSSARPAPSEYRIEEKAPSVIHGTAEHVRAELERLHRQHGVREFVIDTPIADGAERLASIELLAKAHFTVAAA